MNALVSLPSLTRHTANRLRHSKRQTVSGVRGNVRLRARHELARAMACGLIKPSDLQQAIQKGDVGIAQLMQAHAVKPVLPTLVNQSFVELSAEPVKQDEVTFIKAWIHSFAKHGYIQADEINQIVTNNFDRSTCQELVETSLQRLSEKVVSQLGDVSQFTTCHYTPINIEAQLNGVQLDITDAFIGTCPADVYADPDFFRAFDGALLGSRNRFLWGLTTGLEESDGMTNELMEDIALRATVENGHWKIPSDLVDTMEEEYGWDIADMQEVIDQHLNHNKQRETLKLMRDGSKELKKWYKTAEPKKVKIIQQIHQLNALYSDYVDSHPVEIELESDYCSPMTIIVEANHGFNDTVIENFDQMVSQDSCITDLKVPNMAQLFEGIEAALMDIAITHIIFNLVTDYEQSNPTID